MKKKTHPILVQIFYLVLILCGIGLVLALAGMIFNHDPIYYAGLILATPLFVIVLPVCILLIALCYIVGIIQIFRNLFSVILKKLPSTEDTKH